MKKKTNKIIISLIIVFVAFILGTVFGQEVKADDYVIPIHYHNGIENWQIYRSSENVLKIKHGETVETVNKINPNIGITHNYKDRETNLAYKNIVSQNNIFCIQNGKALSYSDKYAISTEKKLESKQNPLLAYILCNGGNFTGMKGYTWYADSEQQKAIWNYINVNNGNINGYTAGLGGSYTTNLYNKAIKYNNSYKAYSPKITLKVSSGKIEANYSGLMGNVEDNESVLTLYENGVKKQEIKVSEQTGTAKFNEITYNASKTYKCELKSYRTDYSTIYYILWCSGLQDILAVVHTEKNTIPNTVSAEIKKTATDVDISMQKYISAINGSSLILSRENWKTYDGDQTYILRDPAKNIVQKNSYKNVNMLK